MLSSFSISVLFVVLHRSGIALGTHRELLVTIAFTTVCWVVTAYVGPGTDRQTLIEFYKKVHPFGPGWKSIRKDAGITPAEAASYAQQDNIPLAMLGWLAGTSVIWSGLFTVGNYLYGRTEMALALAGVFVVSGSLLLWVTRRLWR